MAENKVLHLQVMGGLGSRLRVVVGALVYCQKVGRRLVVHWPRNEPSETLGVFDCRLSDLYAGPFEETGADETHWTGVKDPAVLKEHGKSEIRFRTDKIEAFVFYANSADYRDAFFRLRATDELLREMLGVGWPPEQKMIGVHVRHANKAPESVPAEWYLDRLDVIQLLHGNRWNVFLACDDPSVIEPFAERFGARLLTLNKSFEYDHLGIVRQCADMELLRRCDWMIGANHSSFSQHVALTRGAMYVRDSNYQACVIGGRYEDAWCKPDAGDLARAMRIDE